MIKKSYLLILVFLMGIISPTLANNNSENEVIVKFSKTTIPFKVGDIKQIMLTVNEEQEKTAEYVWTSLNPEIIEIVATKPLSSYIHAKSEGHTTLRVEWKTDKKKFIDYNVIVNKDGIIKILAIGNSFSEDAIEQYLHELISDEGIKVIIGNMYIGGCSLATHWENIESNIARYAYRKIDLQGVKNRIPNTSVKFALADEYWDFISIQQASGFSGQYETYEKDLPRLMTYLRASTRNKNTEFILHQTWAYASTSKHNHFPHYNNNQMEMYKAIVNASRKAAELTNIETIVPAGTAIQNARTSSLGDNLCRDGYHLDLVVGRYAAACTWLEVLFGADARSNSYKPEALSEEHAKIARIAAHLAAQKPFDVTDMSKCKIDSKKKELKPAA